MAGVERSSLIRGDGAGGSTSNTYSTATSGSQLSYHQQGLEDFSELEDEGNIQSDCRCSVPNDDYSTTHSLSTSTSRSLFSSWRTRDPGPTGAVGTAVDASTAITFSARLNSLNPRRLRYSYIHRRLPCNKKIWLVYAMFFLYGIAEFSATLFLFFGLDAYATLNPPETVAVYLLIRCTVYTTFPVMGLLADTFFGRYRVIMASLYISLLGTVILAIGFSTTLDPWLIHNKVDYYHTIDFYEEKQWSSSTMAFLAIVYAVMWVGFTGIQVNLIPFGVDQLVEASSGELSSYFHCYFWWLNAGYLVAASIVPYIYRYYSLGLVFLMMSMCFTGMILILILYRDNGFVIQPQIGNPLKLVYQVVRSSFRAQQPRFRSAFDVGRRPLSRLDLAMRINGGHFTVEQVEDVKTFFRIFLILLSFFGYFAVASQLQTTYLMEGMRMTVPQGSVQNCTQNLLTNTHFFENVTRRIECQMWKVVPSLWLALANFVPVLILIPIFDRLVYVCFRIKMFKRMAIGKFFLFMSIVVAIAVEAMRLRKLWDHFAIPDSTIVINAIPFHTESTVTFHTASPLSIFWITPQYFVFAFAEVFASITAVEFIYAQSPGAMKGVLLGMLFLTEGIAMGFAAFIIFLQGQSPHFHFTSFFGNSNNYATDILSNCLLTLEPHHEGKCVDGPLFSYVLLAVVVILAIVVFTGAAIKYSFRKRDIEPYNPNF